MYQKNKEIVWMIFITEKGERWRVSSDVFTRCEQFIRQGWTGHDLRLCLKSSFAFMTDELAVVLIDGARASLELPSECFDTAKVL